MRSRGPRSRREYREQEADGVLVIRGNFSSGITALPAHWPQHNARTRADVAEPPHTCSSPVSALRKTRKHNKTVPGQRDAEAWQGVFPGGLQPIRGPRAKQEQQHEAALKRTPCSRAVVLLQMPWRTRIVPNCGSISLTVFRSSRSTAGWSWGDGWEALRCDDLAWTWNEACDQGRILAWTEVLVWRSSAALYCPEAEEVRAHRRASSIWGLQQEMSLPEAASNHRAPNPWPRQNITSCPSYLLRSGMLKDVPALPQWSQLLFNWSTVAFLKLVLSVIACLFAIFEKVRFISIQATLTYMN